MKKITFLLLALFLCVQVQAQVNLYSFAQSNQTYSEITGGTVLATATNEQTPVSLKWTLPASTIPFNFNFNGIDYTGCTIYSNGFLTFGTTEEAATATNPISATTTYSGAISAWTGSSCGVHIPGLITSEASWKVVGTAPNREFVIQFKDWRSVFATSVTDVAFVNFQIRLAETTNQIKIVYGPNGYKIGSAAYTGTRQIGLRGAANTDYKNRTNSTTQLFTASTAGTSNSVTQAINTSVATPGMPTNGLVYTYTPPVACTGTPVAGTVAPAAQNLCASSTPAVLTLTGNSEGFTGLTFQWETSTDNATWTNATGTSATTMVYSPPSFAGTASVYYRCKITCTGSALFSYSNVASVNPAAAPVGQATGLNFTNIAQLGFTANWTNSDGNRRVVYISTSPIVDPANGPGAAFTAATAYTGTGQQLVYDNTGSSVTVTGLLPNTQYYVKVIQYLRCGSAAPYDYYFNATSVSNASTVTTIPPVAIPWSEGFATTTLPAYWAQTGFTIGNTLVQINPALASNYIYRNSWSSSTTGNLVTPIFAPVPANHRFVFNYKANDYGTPYAASVASSGNMIIAVSTNNGTTYTDVVTEPNNGIAGWQTYSLNLAAYTGQSIRIRVTFNWIVGDYYMAFDNFKIEAIPTCEAPLWSSMIAANVTATSATISWAASTTTPANGYDYFVSTTSTDPLTTATPTGSVAAGIVTAGLSALAGNTSYNVWVRSKCATSDVSSWSGPITFKTLCNNVTAFTQNFDGVTSTAMPSCWEKVGTLGSCYTSTSTPVGSAPNVIYFYGTSTSAPTMRMQPVSNLGAGTHRMKFKMRSSSATTLPSVDLGYLTNPYDATTFVSLTSIASTATTMVEYVYAPPAGTYSDYPAIKMNGTVYGTVYLDDFVWEAIPTCTDPSALVSANVTSSSVDISWDAPNPAPALGYQYVISTSNTPPTASGTSVTTTFAQVTTGLLPTTQYYVFVRSICSTTDASPWAGPITFTTACAPITTLPHVEPFATFLPSVCWLRGDNGTLTAGPATFGSNSWVADGLGNNGTTGAVRYNLFVASANDWIISPQFTIPATGWELKFDAAAANYGVTTAVTNWEADDFVEVLVSSTGTTNWTPLYTYNNTNVPAPAGVPNIIDLDAYAGQTVRFAYRAVEGTADGAADFDFSFDNFEIRLTPACPQPTNLVVSGITATGAATSWDAMSGAASGYEYVISTSATPPTGAGTAITTTFVALTGLTPQTTYYLYVRANCGSGSFSVWSVQTFTTQCAPVTTLPWTEGFESVTTPAFPPCWFEQNGDYATSDATFDNTPKSGTKYLRDSWTATNEYMWTPGFQLTAGTSYDFSSWIQGDGGNGWVVDYFVNSSQVSTGATQLGATYNVPGTGTLAIQPYAKITRTFVPTTSGVYYFAFRVNQPNSAPNYVAFDDVELKVTPNVIPTCATGITATPNTTCGNFANQLSWNNVTDATGYYVTIGTTSGGTNIANAVPVSSNSYSFSGTINTQYFWKVVPFSGAGSATGCTEQSFTTVATGCYCASVPTTNDGSGITNATVGTTPFVIADVTYVNNTTTAIAVEPGTNTNVQLVFATGYTYDINIWIDFNNDFDFNDAGELVKTGIACTAANPNTVDASFLMPLTAPTGPHRMRIGTADSGQVPPAPCYNGAYGVTLDFTVDTTLGSNSFDTSNFVAYPNPVKDVLNLSYKTAISNVKVINLLGQEVVNANANTNDVQVNMSALSAGVYIVNVTVDDTVHSIKVIKE
ncbi:fibronectin type III domain-containing protein [Flavobacterium sp.]|jgi:hypothetical protein|uniref:fibronectin type III domain-containing protein n=1 Tax=Flavobacterium sp. TaxID=239 RepID=UPI0037BFCACA